VSPIQRCSIVALAAAASLLAAADRIAGPIDAARTVTLRGHVRPEAQPQFDLGPVDPAQELSHVTLFLSPAPGLETFLAEQQTPGSPDYHRWLMPEEFASRFGLSEHDVAALAGWLESQGLRVEDVARGRHWIAFSGSADRMSRAFHTPIHRFRVGGAAHFANTAAPSIPQAFEDVVSAIGGLDDFRPQPTIVPAGPAYNISTSHLLAPDDLAAIFDIKKLYQAGIDGSGQTIVIAGQTDFDLSDIQAFRQRFGLPPNDPQKVIYGTNPGKNSDMIEADLDLEWAGAIAPNATVIFAFSENVFLSAQYAIDRNLGPIVSMSYSACEPYESAGFMRGVWQQANAQGITLLASSGDAGAANCERYGPTPQASKGPTVGWPASLPEVTGVGGTAFNDASGGPYWASGNDANLGSALGYIPEIAWNESAMWNALVATGGGPSALFAKPYWQRGPGVPGDGARDVPDISLPASTFHYPYMITTAGANTAGAGTSASTTSVAGILALLNQYLVAKGVLSQPGLGNINPALYQLAQATTDVFHDVTAGDNKVPCEQASPGCVDGLMGFSAGPGYDMTTGLGSVDVYNLATEWNTGAASATALTASPSSGAAADSLQLTATVKSASGSGAAPTGAVTFLAHDTVLGSVALAASGAVSTATLTVTGNALGAGASAVAALYPGDAVYAGSSGAATISIQLPAGGGSAVVAAVNPNPVVQAGIYWPFTITLTERAGVATTLTGFSVGGVSEPVAFFTSPNIPAGGSISASVVATGLLALLNRTFVFSGSDADGKTWSQQIVVSFAGPASQPLEPVVDLIGAPTVAQSGTDPTCAYPVQLTVQESGGFLMQLTSLSVSGTSYTSLIQQTFGTTRLAPYGMVQGTLCLAGTVGTGTMTVQLVSTSVELGMTVTSTLAVTLTSAPASQTAMTASPAAVTMSVADASQNAAAAVSVGFAAGSPAWTATVSPENSASAWIVVSPISGSGPATVQIQATGAGLSKGAYRAVISIQSAAAIPETIDIPVTFVVGASAAIAIGGIANNFSGGTDIAPGTLAAVYGTNLAPATQTAATLPLPLTLQGVSVTVNGIGAPFYYVSPGQLDVQIPYETGRGPAVLAVNDNGRVAVFPFTVSTTAPGLYPSAISNTTGSLVSAASAGQVLLLFMTGEGDVTPFLATGASPASGTAVSKLPAPILPVKVTVGGVPATVSFAGIPSGLVGVSQIDFTVPAAVPPGPQPVVVTVGSVSAPAVTLTIAGP
jgi:uncharacterized protein (TIGR03437 family)